MLVLGLDWCSSRPCSDSHRAWYRDSFLGDGPSGITGKLSAIVAAAAGSGCFFLCNLTVAQLPVVVPSAIWSAGTDLRRGPMGSRTRAEVALLLILDRNATGCGIATASASDGTAPAGNSIVLRGESGGGIAVRVVVTCGRTYGRVSYGSSIDVKRRTAAPWPGVPVGVESSTSS